MSNRIQKDGDRFGVQRPAETVKISFQDKIAADYADTPLLDIIKQSNEVASNSPELKPYIRLTGRILEEHFGVAASPEIKLSTHRIESSGDFFDYCLDGSATSSNLFAFTRPRFKREEMLYFEDEELQLDKIPQLIKDLYNSQTGPNDSAHYRIDDPIFILDAPYAALRQARVQPLVEGADKVSQREEVRDFGQFRQPKFIDARRLNPSGRTAEFKNIDFDFIDWEEFKNRRSLILIDNFTSGFIIGSDGNGRGAVYTEHPILSHVLNKKFGPTLDSVDLDELLQVIRQIGRGEMFSIVKQEPIRGWDRETLTKLLGVFHSHSGAIYIKSTRSSGGSMVIRLGKESDGNLVLETNSEDTIFQIGSVFKGYVKVASELSEAITKYGENSILVDQIFRPRVSRSLPDLSKILSHILDQMPAPIIEGEIPRVKRRENLVEFRIIVQSSALQKTPEVVAHYCKVSDLSVAANITLGGWGEPTLKVLEDIYREKLPHLEANEIASCADETLREIIDKSNEFAQRRFERGSRKLGALAQHSYAIDLVPAWNAETNRIDLYLMEVQFPFGFEGLKDIDAASAAKVRQNIELIEEQAADIRSATINELFGHVSPKRI